MGLTTIIGGFVLALTASLGLTKAALVLGEKTGIVDRPDGFRKLHERVVPRVGGVAIFFAVILPSAVLLAALREIPLTIILRMNLRPLVVCGSGAVLAVLLGLLDDIFDLKPVVKLIGQLVIAGFMYIMGFKIAAVINPLTGGNVYLGILEIPVTMIWFVACMNIVNLLDGIDGLAAGACAFVGITLFFLSLSFHNDMGMFLMACYTGAILGFLFFNFPPARIFLGDSGSLLLGYLIASLTLMGGIRKADAAVALFIPLVALGLPLLDTSLAIVRRRYKRLPISSSDKQHIHHRLVKGLGHTKALLTLYAMCVLLLGAALLLMFGSNEVVIFVLALLSLFVFICFRFFSGIKATDMISRMTETRIRRDQRSESLAMVYRAVGMMENAADNDAVWPICRDLFAALEVNGVELVIAGKAYKYEQKEIDTGEDPDGDCTLRLPLRIGDGTPSDISFSIKRYRNRTSPVDIEMMTVLRDGLEKYLAGIPEKE